MARVMKDSGVEWIGDIPEHWGITNISQHFKQVKNKNKGMQEKNRLSLSYGKIIQKDINTSEGLLPESFEGYNIIKSDDIVLRMTDLQNDHTSLRVGFSHEDGIITSAYITIRKYNSINPSYAYYFLHSFDICKGFYGMGSGVRQGVTFDMLKKLNIILPCEEEQKKIVAFLDEKTSHIDSIISQTKESIEAFKAYKQALITETVTKGLNPDVKMNDSGIEWIGEIPEHWDVVKLSQYFKQVKSKNKDMQESNRLSLSYGKIIQRDINTSEGLLPASFEGYNIISPEDIVLRMTDLQNDHTSLRVGLSHEKGIVTSAYITIRKYNLINSAYAYYFLHSFDVYKGFYGMGSGVRQGVTFDMLKKLEIILPKMSEQKQIVDFLDEKTAHIDSLIADKEKMVQKLEEYKRSLIYEYVTGKKEV